MDGSYCVKPLKQKQVVNTPAFLLSLSSSLCVTFMPLKDKWYTKALFPSWTLRLAHETCRLCSSLCSSLSGGWSELSTAGDLWDREQIQQPRIKGKYQMTRALFLSAPLWLHQRRHSSSSINKSMTWKNLFFSFKVADDEISDNSAECVVCLSDVRDTLILPCRHLCLCNACADTLRYQANCCPICRLREFPSTMTIFFPKWMN